MITLELEQLSPEWYASRAGIPTASCFDKIVTSKGEPSKQAKNYMYQLAGEVITGSKTETYHNATMARGIEMEPEAVALYELLRDTETHAVGLCYPNKQKRYACSPDRLCGEVGGLELKCPMIHTHVAYLLKNKLPTEYVQQVQGSLFITGRKWWDFMSYYPGLTPLIIRVSPDVEFMKKLKSELTKFCTELKKTVAALKKM